jgi:hypothetical protein
MQPEARERLLEFARAEISARTEELRLVGGPNVVLLNDVLSLRPRAPRRPEVAEAQTWELVIFGVLTTVDSVSGETTYPLQAISRVPRVSGVPNVQDAVWWERTQLRDGGASTKSCRIEFFTRRFDPASSSPIFDNGTPYGGAVNFTLMQRVVGGPGTAVAEEVVRIFAITGSGEITFTASGAAAPATLLELRPVSVARVR